MSAKVAGKRSRRLKRISKRAASVDARWGKARGVLAKVGIKPERIPREMAELLARGPKNELRITVPEHASEDERALAMQVEATVRARMEVKVEETSGLTLGEYFGPVLSWLFTLGNRARALPARGDVHRAIGSFQEVFERLEPETFLVALYGVVEDVVRSYSLHEQHLLEFEFASMRPLEIALRTFKPEERTFDLGGRARTCYRVGGRAGDEFEWTRWDRIALCLPGVARELPVFVQAHALERIVERLGCGKSPGHAQKLLQRSMRDARIVKRQSERDVLVAVESSSGRLGYLAVTVLDDAVVVRTFKFLTMDGTPEGERLRKSLKLARPDVDFLELAKLSTFLETDLCSDPTLRPILDACGVGHLCDRAAPRDEVRPHAAWVKKYLGMGACDLGDSFGSSDELQGMTRVAG